MAFTYTSTLPKPISEAEDFSKVSAFQMDIDTIKKYLVEIGNTYLLVAFRIYEMEQNKSYKAFYKNIVDACSECLGFKKSTTYNMLNIVKTFGSADASGRITFQSLFKAEKFSYSQLCEMLSLSDHQRSLVTPDMTVKDIRQIKKNDVIDIPVEEIKEVSVESFQTSGKIVEPDVDQLLSSNCELRAELDEVNARLSIYRHSVCENTKQSCFIFCCSNCNIQLADLDDIEVVGSSKPYPYGYTFKFCPECGCRVTNYQPFSDDYYED